MIGLYVSSLCYMLFMFHFVCDRIMNFSICAACLFLYEMFNVIFH